MDTGTEELVLTREELQRAADIGASKPDFEALRIKRQEKDLAVPRNFVIDQIIASVPGFSNRSRGYFDIKEGWEALGITLSSDQGENEDLGINQPTPEQLAAWETMAAEMADRQGISKEEALRRVRVMMAQGKGILAEKEVKRVAEGRMAVVPAGLGVKETTGIGDQGRAITNKKIDKLQRELAVVYERAEREKAAGVYSFREILAHPTIGVGRLGGYMKAYTLRVLGRYTAEELAEAIRQENLQVIEEAKQREAGIIEAKLQREELAEARRRSEDMRIAKETVQGAKNLAETAVKAGIKQAGGTSAQVAAKKGIEALLAKLGLGAIPGLNAVALALLIKDLGKKIFDREFFKNLASRVAMATGAAILWMMVNPIAALFGIGGAIFLGPFITPIGGFLVGSAVGWGVQSALGMGASVPVASAAIPVATIGGGTSTLAAIASGGAAPVMIAVGGTTVFTLVTVMATGAAMVGAPQNSLDRQGVPPIFTVTKTAEPATIDNLKAGESKTISYAIQINPSGNSQVTISDFSDKVVAYTAKGVKNDLVINLKDDPKGKTLPLLVTGEMVVSGEAYNDSNVINTVTVKGKDKDGKEQTQSATAVLTIGNPIDGSPYGFPKEGSVTTLDRQWVTNPDGYRHEHCGELDPPSTSCTPGGIDIGGTGNVVSTVDGYVDLSYFDCFLGGVVRIRSTSGAYTVTYIHLNKEGMAQPGPVIRGKQIGSVYNKYDQICGTNTEPGLGASTGPHVHYQVLAGGGNLDFGDGNNAGKCSAGKIEPEVPTDTIKAPWVAPACQ